MTTLKGNTTRYKKIAGHFLAWCLYIAFIHGANLLADPKLKIPLTILFFIPLCITFYTAVYFLNRFKEKGIAGVVASFFLVFIIMAAVCYVYIYLLLPLIGAVLYTNTGLTHYFKAALLGYVQYFSYALLYFYVRELILKERRLRKAEAAQLKEQLEKLEMEYAFLRSQVNPHFLHNSLNLLFAQALNHSEELADNVEKLSLIMHYSLDGTKAGMDRVPVETELKQLQLLISFHELRFDGSRPVSYECIGEPSGQLVPPLSLITVLENAFKHGDLKDPLHPLKISVLLEKGTVHFSCSNKKNNSILPLSSHHIGMKNLRQRLEHAFAGNYQLNIHEDETCYDVELTLKSQI